MFIYKYLPKELQPENFEDISFEEFFRLWGMADIARDLEIEDRKAGVNQGIISAFPED